MKNENLCYLGNYSFQGIYDLKKKKKPLHMSSVIRQRHTKRDCTV